MASPLAIALIRDKSLDRICSILDVKKPENVHPVHNKELYHARLLEAIADSLEQYVETKDKTK